MWPSESIVHRGHQQEFSSTIPYIYSSYIYLIIALDGVSAMLMWMPDRLKDFYKAINGHDTCVLCK
jgi:hypothetical protein